MNPIAKLYSIIIALGGPEKNSNTFIQLQTTLTRAVFDADLENDLADDSYDRPDADLYVRLDLLFVHLVIKARGNYNRGYGDDEGSQFPGGVGAGCPGLLPCCDCPESLFQIARPVENGEQMESDVRLKSKALQQSTEYFLGFEDYVPLDICCPLVYVVVPA